MSAVKRTKIAEIFWNDDDAADRFYLVKVAFITIDEKTGAEKKASSLILTQAMLKTLYEIIILPVTLRAVRLLRRIEETGPE